MVEGQVRDPHSQADTNWFSRGQGVVVNFRVEGFDAVGNRIFLVPVEIRGLTVQGFPSPGDWVRAAGRDRGGTIRAKVVQNLTTGSVIRPRGLPWYMKTVYAVFMAAILAFMAWVFWHLFTGSEASPIGLASGLSAGVFRDARMDSSTGRHRSASLRPPEA
jgi:hypothetical protein